MIRPNSITGWFKALPCALLVVSNATHAQQWQPSLATVASLRTGGATIVSSDSLEMDDGNIAFVTYWEARSHHYLDVYRCIDVVDSTFQALSQECWSALRPTGRGPVVHEGVRSSNDICGTPNDLGGISEAAYCAFTRSAVIRTPYFELAIEPPEDEGLVSVSDEGRALFITSPPWPSSTFLEVRATSRRERNFFARTATTPEILDLADDDTECTLVTISNREWAACRTSDAPGIRTHYLIQDDLLYEVSFNEDVPAEVRVRLDRVFSTLKPVSEEG